MEISSSSLHSNQGQAKNVPATQMPNGEKNPLLLSKKITMVYKKFRYFDCEDFKRMKLCFTFKWLQHVGRMRALASATPEVNTGLFMQALMARILARTKGSGQDSLGKLSNISEVSLDRSNGVRTSRKYGYVDTMWSKKTTCPLEKVSQPGHKEPF